MSKDPEIDRLLALVEAFVGDGAATIGGATTTPNVGSFPVPLGVPLRSPNLARTKIRKRRKSKRTEP